ncbi:hypothetical protein F5Y14DRAFT_450512 [Nemania sp. NC0429]|nr:hypothetical protein F5Y14DRAFT_450512 [Nemania sp. NC0429]
MSKPIMKPRVINANAPTSSPASRMPRMPIPPRSKNPPLPRAIVDTSSEAYKQNAAKYMRFLIGMPILIVTSYVLFDRLVLGNEVKPYGLPSSSAVVDERDAK